MTKIGNSCSYLCWLFLLILSSLPVSGQEISVSASLSETNIFSGEGVRLDITISGQNLTSIDRPQIPAVEGLRWLQGSTGQSTNYSYINGRPSVSYTYNYQFIAQNPGNYTFPPLSIDVNGERFTTSAIAFTILDPQTIDTGEAQRSPDIYVRLEPSTTSPVVGEQVIADVVLYFKNEVEVSSYQASPGWKAEGFWKEELENRQQARTTSTIINGVRYQRAKLLQYAIFPTKSGELTLSPFDIVVQVRKKNRRRDIFSFGLGQERMELSTLPVTITSRPLPELNNAVFSGAVGKFQIKRTINPETAYVGESVEITTTISGEGNIPLIVKPGFSYPDALEQYDPQENSTITRSNRQIAGSKTFTDIIIARNEGTFEIPAVSMAYYDPERKRYSTVQLPALSLTSKRDPRALTTTADELRFDIRPITGLASWTKPNELPLQSRPWVWFLLVVPVFTLAMAYVVKSYHERMNTDSAFARAQKAKEKATQSVAQISAETSIKEGYHLIEKTLIQFISDKLDLPKAGLSNAQLVNMVEETTTPEIARDVKRLLDKCETISYAPNTSPEGLETDRQKTEALIKTLGKQL